MLAITCASLAGGQGKTTTCYFLGKLLAQTHRVIMVDADPQSSLTFYMGLEVAADQPTLLEVLQKQVDAEDAVYNITDNMWLIPSDDALDKVQAYLGQSSVSPATTLRRRLKPLNQAFDFCIVDAPPQRSHLCVTAIGCADRLLIPVEASSKGANSLARTLELVREMEEEEALPDYFEVLGILPFRDRWIGKTQAKQSQRSIEAFRSTGLDVLPSILESEQFKKAIDKGVLLSEIGQERLEYPFQIIKKQLI